MPASRSPKFIASKLGLVSAIALCAVPMLGAEALATPAVPSDTLLVTGGNNNANPNGQQAFEIGETALTDTMTINESENPLQDISGTKAIELTEPGTTDISDIVTANLTSLGAENSFTLTVTLTSDGETPLSPTTDPVCSVLPETGGVQHLASVFTSCFGLDPLAFGEVLVIDVSSDISDTSQVPEPGSLALLGAGLAGLAFARRRRKA